MNDTIISFYLEYLRDTLGKENTEVAKRVFFHNSFFYDKLTSAKGAKNINYDGVKKWTAKIDLLSYDYIIVPVNENAHWWVAIICNAPRLLPKPASITSDGEADLPGAAERGHQQGTANDGGVQEAMVGPFGSVGWHGTASPDGNSFPTTNMTRSLNQMSISPSPELEEARRSPSFEKFVEAKPQMQETTFRSGDDDDDDNSACDTSARSRSKPTRLARRPVLAKRTYDPREPRIITLDSLGSKHSPAVGHLKSYLIAEIKERKGLDAENPGNLGMTASTIPLQSNFCDCGVYLLGYIREFVKNPDAFISGILQKEVPAWGIDASALRTELRELIFKLQKENQDRESVVRWGRSRKRSKGIVSSGGTGRQGAGQSTATNGGQAAASPASLAACGTRDDALSPDIQAATAPTAARKAPDHSPSPPSLLSGSARSQQAPSPRPSPGSPATVKDDCAAGKVENDRTTFITRNPAVRKREPSQLASGPSLPARDNILVSIEDDDHSIVRLPESRQPLSGRDSLSSRPNRAHFARQPSSSPEEATPPRAIVLRAGTITGRVGDRANASS